MGITSLDGIVAGMQPPIPVMKNSFTGQAAGGFHSSFYIAGFPGAATAPSPGLAGAALTSYTGQIQFPSAISSQTVYLAGLTATCSANVGAVMLVDRLWHNSGLVMTTTTAQTINSVAFPARDNTGTTNGLGVLVGLEVSTVTGNGAPITNTTMSYTDSGGTAGLTATIASFPAAAVAGTFVPFSLSGSSTSVGVRSIQTVTLGTSYVSGVMSLVAYRVLAILGLPTSNVANRSDAVQLGFPTLYSSTVPFMIYVLSGTAGGLVAAQVSYAQG